MSTDPSQPADPAAPPASVPTAAPVAESFGHYLSRERELRGVTLLQISEQTRIGQSHLKALEQDDPSRLPARVFVLGHIRAYARAVGLNPDEAVLRFEEQHQRLHPPVEEAQGPRFKRRWWAAAIGVGAALLAGVLWLLLRQRR